MLLDNYSIYYQVYFMVASYVVFHNHEVFCLPEIYVTLVTLVSNQSVRACSPPYMLPHSQSVR
jgi:hypothetical protein